MGGSYKVLEIEKKGEWEGEGERMVMIRMRGLEG